MPGTVEREVKLGAAPGFHMPPLDALGEGVSETPPEELRLDTFYHDTPDYRLARWGFSLRHRAREGWTLKVPGSTRNGMLSRGEYTFSGGARTVPEEALDMVRAVIRREALVPVAHLWTRRRKVRLEGATGNQLAEVVDDEVSVLDGRRVAARFRELEVELKGGDGEQILEPLVGRLQAAGAGTPDPTPKHIRALGPRARTAPDPAEVPLPAKPTAGDCLRRALAADVRQLIQHHAGVWLGDDPEDVHQARVATRRLRSHLRGFRSLVDPEWAGSLRTELSWLGGELGAVRDGQVLLERLRALASRLAPEDNRQARALARRLEVEVAAARRRLISAMASERYLDLLDDLVRAAESPQLTEEAERPADEVLAQLTTAAWRRVRRAVRALSPEPPDEELHQIRILAKRLRYMAEAAALVAGPPAQRLAKAAARLQTVLGEHQDSVTAQAWLRSQPLRGRPAFVAGELYALESSAQAAARAQWPDAWKTLRQPRLRAGLA